MKALSLFLFFFTFQLVSAAQTPTFKTAVEYNDYIIALQVKVGESIGNFNKAVDSGSLSYANAMRERIVKVAEEALVRLRKMPAYNGNSSLKAATIPLFEFYKSCAENEYKEMITLVLGGGKIDDAVMERINKLVTQVTERENVLDQKFGAEQKKFAKDNNFTLSGDESE
jgi:hypothetical protein